MAPPAPSEGGGYGYTYGQVEIVQYMNHNGEVNRARYCPQQPNIIATKSPSGDVYIFDRNSHPTKPHKNSPCAPDFRLVGHEKEGFGLAWNSKIEGQIVSGSDDKLICLWDISSQLSNRTQTSTTTTAIDSVTPPDRAPAIDPIATFKAHTDVVEDVCFHAHNPHLFLSCSDDRTIMIWDTRGKDTPTVTIQAHSAEVNCLSYNPFDENLFISGSADKSVGLWDIRNTTAKLHSFEAHADQVVNVAWSPFSQTILASASKDKRAHIWDMTKIGKEQDPEDAEDGPPELLFIHGGHTDKIADFAWNPNDDWVCASVADDNVLQIWQLAEDIWNVEDDEQEEKQIDNEDLE